jgi:hypothetical protein
MLNRSGGAQNLRDEIVMGKENRFAPEVREQAVRLVFEQERNADSQWAAMCSIPAASAWFRHFEPEFGPVA